MYAKRYFLYWRHRNRYIVYSKNIRSILGEKKAPAGTLGGAPSMFLCLGDIESASFMSHLCPQGSNGADFMYLRHKNRDSEFLKNRMSYFGNYTIWPTTENRAFFEDWESAVIPF